jgi:hypothetical protein
VSCPIARAIVSLRPLVVLIQASQAHVVPLALSADSMSDPAALSRIPISHSERARSTALVSNAVPSGLSRASYTAAVS